MRNLKAKFYDRKLEPALIACTAWGIGHDWPVLSALIDETLARVDGEAAIEATRFLIQGVYSFASENDPSSAPVDLPSCAAGQGHKGQESRQCWQLPRLGA